MGPALWPGEPQVSASGAEWALRPPGIRHRGSSGSSGCQDKVPLLPLMVFTGGASEGSHPGSQCWGPTFTGDLRGQEAGASLFPRETVPNPQGGCRLHGPRCPHRRLPVSSGKGAGVGAALPGNPLAPPCSTAGGLSLASLKPAGSRPPEGPPSPAWEGPRRGDRQEPKSLGLAAPAPCAHVPSRPPTGDGGACLFLHSLLLPLSLARSPPCGPQAPPGHPAQQAWTRKSVLVPRSDAVIERPGLSPLLPGPHGVHRWRHVLSSPSCRLASGS